MFPRFIRELPRISESLIQRSLLQVHSGLDRVRVDLDLQKCQLNFRCDDDICLRERGTALNNPSVAASKTLRPTIVRIKQHFVNE